MLSFSKWQNCIYTWDDVNLSLGTMRSSAEKVYKPALEQSVEAGMQDLALSYGALAGSLSLRASLH